MVIRPASKNIIARAQDTIILCQLYSLKIHKEEPFRPVLHPLFQLKISIAKTMPTFLPVNLFAPSVVVGDKKSLVFH